MPPDVGDCSSIADPATCEGMEANPCESDDPPDYCDEAGSCFNKNIGNARHRRMLEAMESQGMLDALWDDSALDLAQRKRKEQGGFLVPNSYDDGYTFQRLQPGQITQQTKPPPTGSRWVWNPTESRLKSLNPPR